jgi:hypothetical protein
MKTFLLLILVLRVSFTLSAQTVQSNKMALMMKKTATWCGPCGTWGWSAFDDIYNRTTGEAFIGIELHSSTSSQLNSLAATTIYSNLESVSSTPAFYVNNVNETEYSSSGGIYPSTTKQNVYDAIDSVGQVLADINAGYTATVDNGTITVKTKVKAFNTVTGDYYLGVYLLEKDVENYQSGIGNNAVHKSVLREAISTSIMGDQIATGSIVAGTEFTNTFTHTVNANYDTTALQVFVVLWEKVGNDYLYESAYSDNTNLQSSTIVNVTRIQDQHFTPEAYTDGAQLYYQLENAPIGAQVQVTLINTQGQPLRVLHQGTAQATIQTAAPVADLPKGVYFIRTLVGNSIKTISIVL